MMPAEYRGIVASTGRFQPVSSKEDLEQVLDTLIKRYNMSEWTRVEVSPAEIYQEDLKPTHVCLTLAKSFNSISIVVEDPEEEEDFQLDNPNGILAYVYNIDDPHFSELGYIVTERFMDPFLDQFFYRRKS